MIGGEEALAIETVQVVGAGQMGSGIPRSPPRPAWRCTWRTWTSGTLLVVY